MKVLVPVILIVVVVIAISVTAEVGWVNCRILQYKLDRVYFDVGEEARVFAGHRYVIRNGKDTILSGTIEQSYDGVAISSVTSRPFDRKKIAGCTASIETAPVDSHAVMRIGYAVSPLAIILPPRLGLVGERKSSSQQINDYVDSLSQGVVDTFRLIHYTDPLAMQVDYEGGFLDGYLSYGRQGTQEDDIRIITAPAPFIAVLIPNVASLANAQGALTTSLIYRFDPSRLTSVFDGVGAVPVHSFQGGDTSVAVYAFSPEKGRRLFRDLPDRPTRITLNVADENLRRLAGYFADVLAREQCRTTITETDSIGDIRVAFVPDAGVDPVVTLDSLSCSLWSDASATGQASEAAVRIRGLAQAAREDADTLHRKSLCLTIQSDMISELGCFPLFRPQLHFVSHKSVVGEVFDQYGRADISRLIKLKPIAPSHRR